jgi:predicted dehydrogenase
MPQENKPFSAINIGIIGPGRVAERHALALKDMSQACLWSVYGRNYSKAQNFASIHQAKSPQPAYQHVEDLLADPELSAVIIATPDSSHTHFINLTMDAGKSILVEKPLCTSLQEGQNLLIKQQKLHSLIMIGHHLRWHTGLRKLAQYCHHNHIDIQHMKLRWGVNFKEHAKWRLNASSKTWCCLSALGTHLLDLTKWFMTPECGKMVGITSQTTLFSQSQSDAKNIIMLKFQSGATAEINCSLLEDYPFELELYTKNGLIQGENLVGEFEKRKIWIQNAPFLFKNENTYQNQLNAFVQLIIDKQKPTVSLEEAPSS